MSLLGKKGGVVVLEVWLIVYGVWLYNLCDVMVGILFV